MTDLPTSMPAVPLRDISDRPLGTPAAVYRPASTAEVAAVLRHAHATGQRVVPVGCRTGYWWPLNVDGAIALDVTGLTDVDYADGVAEVGAGALVRPVDVYLRQRGRALPYLPDAFGDTPIGALAAMAATSGVGMAQGPFSRCVVGLEVVTGTGEVIRTGASGAWSHLPMFLRDGVPDLTGLFFASEGTLGVITRLWLRVPAAPHLVHLHGGVPFGRVKDLLRTAQQLADTGVIDTFRAVQQPDGVHKMDLAVDVWVRSPFSATEAATRAEAVVASVHGATGVSLQPVPFGEDGRRAEGPGYEDRYSGPMGAHAAFMERAALVGMDVNAPWSTAEAMVDLATAIVAEQRATPGVLATRLALYVAPDFLNLGLHAAAELSPAMRAWSEAHVRRRLGELWAIGCVPYRVGRSWPEAVSQSVAPEVRAAWSAVKAHFDPAGLLHPDHPLLPAPR